MELHELLIVIVMICILSFAIYKEVLFFRGPEHAFGSGNFRHAAEEEAPKEILLEFPSRLIYWRRSVIFGMAATLMVYSTCKCSNSPVTMIFVMFVGITALMYFHLNFYSFHMYKHIADGFKRILK